MLSILRVPQVGNQPGIPIPVRSTVEYWRNRIGEVPVALLDRKTADGKDLPSLVATGLVRQCATYREACVLAVALHRSVGGEKCLRLIAAECRAHAPHMTDYLSHEEGRRELPARYIAGFEKSVGNTAISQWLALASHLPVMEIGAAANESRMED